MSSRGRVQQPRGIYEQKKTPRPTLHLDADRVVVVLQAVQHLAAVDARVAGPQLRHLDGGVGGHQRVVDHGHAVQVLRLHRHLAPGGHQDGGDLLGGDVGPLDAVGEWRHRGAGGSRLLGGRVLEVAWDHHLVAQQRPQSRLHRDADAQRAVQA